MENFNLSLNLHYMVLGHNCYFIGVSSRVRGPVDNIFCCDANYIYKLCDKSYLSIALNDKNIQWYQPIFHKICEFFQTNGLTLW